jgi:hypothetical protein
MTFLKIEDNSIPISSQNYIFDIIRPESNFPWYYRPTTAYGRNEENQKPFFQHFIYFDGTIVSDWYYKFDFKQIFNFPEFKTHKIDRIKLNLYTHNFNKKLIRPHTDMMGKKGIVYIYYPETSDGPTRFYLNKFNTKKVDPIQGRLVKFDARILHTGDIPRKYERRTCINFVFSE